LNLEAIRNLRFEAVTHAYAARDSILYALGLGYGSNPADPAQLAFVYEDDLRTVPSICCVLAHPGLWVKNPALGIDWLKILHGEQSFEIHNPIPSNGTVAGTYEIVAVEDKGAGKGAILHKVKKLTDKASGQLLATVRSVLFLRGDGGCGSFGEIPAPVQPLPERAPSSVCEIATLPQSALIYRLSGDYNPIHADPEAAAKAGFEAPILHGLCTLGVATRALLSTFAKRYPGATEIVVRALQPARFSGRNNPNRVLRRRARNSLPFACRRTRRYRPGSRQCHIGGLTSLISFRFSRSQRS
jgi:MaoC like domain/N-terminal half of MaoC dehydratase